MEIKEQYEMAVARAATNAVAAAWDGCHKIYLLDEDSLHTFRDEYQYGQDSSWLVGADDEATLEKLGEQYEPEGDHFGPFGLEHLVWSWYNDSCGLRFISTDFLGEIEDVIPQLCLADDGTLVS